jgi:hypothetical protein
LTPAGVSFTEPHCWCWPSRWRLGGQRIVPLGQRSARVLHVLVRLHRGPDKGCHDSVKRACASGRRPHQTVRGCLSAVDDQPAPATPNAPTCRRTAGPELADLDNPHRRAEQSSDSPRPVGAYGLEHRSFLLRQGSADPSSGISGRGRIRRILLRANGQDDRRPLPRKCCCPAGQLADMALPAPWPTWTQATHGRRPAGPGNVGIRRADMQASHGNPNVSFIAFPTGGHNYRNYRRYLPTALQWLDHNHVNR